MRVVVAVAVMAWAGAAGADLYRWVDRDSGSIKYSSYPPPWYGDEAKQRRAPKVEVIPAGRSSTKASPSPQDAEPDPGSRGDGSKALEALEARRKQLLGAISAIPPNFDYSRDGPAFRRQLEAFQAVSVEMDRIDPKGAEQRLAEAKTAIERIAAALRSQLGGLVPPAAR